MGIVSRYKNRAAAGIAGKSYAIQRTKTPHCENQEDTNTLGKFSAARKPLDTRVKYSKFCWESPSEGLGDDQMSTHRYHEKLHP